MSLEPSIMKEWMNVIPESEQQTYQKAGFLGKLQLGQRPALIVIDVTYGFTGSESLTLEEAIQEFPTACGPASWEAIPRISRLIEFFRSKKYPIVHTRSSPVNQMFAGRATKSNRAIQFDLKYNEFPKPVAPQDGEWILEKTKASAFFQTPLQAYLVKERIDTLILCGVSTSGCVRASVVDALSHGYSSFVIDDCCFDRSYFSHCTNLFDMNAKYATVLSLHELESIMREGQSSKIV